MLPCGRLNSHFKSFWHGDALSDLERICITSFLDHGFGFELYVYDEPVGVPPGTILRDAAEIIPRDRVFRYQAGSVNIGGLSGFSNLFRYALIQKVGGWWVDTDICCLQPFTIAEEEAYIIEHRRKGFIVASSLFKAPPCSEVMRYCLDVFAQKDVNKIKHGETGPALLTESVLKHERQSKVLPPDLFFPVPWWEYDRHFVDESLSVDGCHTTHFWNVMIKAAGYDKNGSFAANSLYERLKRKHLR